jgi:hypothetical protein
MVNLRRQPVSYRQFQGQAILADGLLAVSRPGGEVEQALANALFGTARVFGERAEQVAGKRGRDAAVEAALGLDPGKVTVTGGDVRYRKSEVSGQEGVQPGLSAPPVPAVETPDVQPSLSAPLPPKEALEKEAPAAEPASSRAPLPKQGKVSPVVNIIATAAARHGVPAQALIKIGYIESKLNPKAKNPNSTAGGLFQQIDGNAAQYGVANRFDAAQSADGAARFMRDNIAHLRKRLGRDPTVGELYLAHQQGGAGAALLLSNPNALASSLVGRDAVRLNGGDPDTTTAAAFAAKWTSKAGDTPVTGELTPIVARVPLDGSVDPSQFTVTRTPVEIEVTGGAAPVLSGRDTIFGRAYDEVLTRHYQSQLDDAMLSGTAAVYEKLKDDPEALAVALSDLKAKQLNEHVPPEVRLDYEQAFSRQERGYLRRAQAARETKIEQEQLAGWQLKDAEIREGLSRAEAGLDLSDEASLERIAGEGRRLKDHLSEGVARGWLSLPQAQEMAANTDADVTAAFYLKQAEGLDPEAIDDLRETMRADYAAGKLAGVTDRAWRKIDSGLTQVGAKTRADQGLEREALQAEIADDVASIGRLGKGLDLNPARVRRLLGKEGHAKWLAAREEAEIMFRATQGLEQMPADEIEKRLTELEPEAGEKGFADKARAFDAAEKRAREILKLRKSDPAAAALDAFPEIVREDPEKDDTRRLQERMRAQGALGIPETSRQPLTNDEAAAIADRIEMFEDDPATLETAMQAVMSDAQKRYGVMADEVMAQVLRQRGIDRATSQLGAAIMREMNLGQIVPPGNFRQLQRLGEIGAAEQAIAGTPTRTPTVLSNPGFGRYGNPSQVKPQKQTLPNARQVQLLRARPELAPDFDKKFGDGAAQGFLKDKGSDARRVLPDGSVELRYEDGWIETLHPDGTVDGRQGP